MVRVYDTTCRQLAECLASLSTVASISCWTEGSLWASPSASNILRALCWDWAWEVRQSCGKIQLHLVVVDKAKAFVDALAICRSMKYNTCAS